MGAFAGGNLDRVRALLHRYETPALVTAALLVLSVSLVYVWRRPPRHPRLTGRPAGTPATASGVSVTATAAEHTPEPASCGADRLRAPTCGWCLRVGQFEATPSSAAPPPV